MKIKLNCSHEVEDYDNAYTINIKAYEVHGRAIHQISVCKVCRDEYIKEGVVLNTWEDECKWLEEGCCG